MINALTCQLNRAVFVSWHFLSFTQGVGNIFAKKNNFKIIAMPDFSTGNFNFPCVLTLQVIGNTGTNGWRNTSTPRITILTSCPFWSQTWIMCEQTTSFMSCPNRERFGTILSCFYFFIFPLFSGGFNLNNCFDCRSLRDKQAMIANN